MNLHGATILRRSPEEIWPLIFDPHSLLGLIPGCESLEFSPPDEYRAEIRLGLPVVIGLYTARIKILHTSPPDHCAFSGEIAGPPGMITGRAGFNLKPVPAGTEISYEAQGIISGALSHLNPRLIETVAHSLIKQGLAQLEKKRSETKLPSSF